MHRFFTDPEPGPDGAVYLSPEDARHALTVLRLKTGQHIEVIRDGLRWDAEIGRIDAQRVSVRILSPLPSTEPLLSVTLFQGLPKADKMDLERSHSDRQTETVLVVILLSKTGQQPAHTNSVRPHNHRLALSLFILIIAVHRL